MSLNEMQERVQGVYARALARESVENCQFVVIALQIFIDFFKPVDDRECERERSTSSTGWA